METMRFNSPLFCQDVFWGNCCIYYQITCHQGLPHYNLLPKRARAKPQHLKGHKVLIFLKTVVKKNHKIFKHVMKELLQHSGTENLSPPFLSA